MRTSLAWYESLGYDIAHGPDIAFDGPTLERDAKANYTDVVLVGQLSSALERINTDLSNDALLPKLISGELHVPDTEKLLDGLSIYGGKHG